MSNIFDEETLIVVIAFALMSFLLYLSRRMSGWDWYFFWTGGPIRNTIYTAVKRLMGYR